MPACGNAACLLLQIWSIHLGLPPISSNFRFLKVHEAHLRSNLADLLGRSLDIRIPIRNPLFTFVASRSVTFFFLEFRPQDPSRWSRSPIWTLPQNDRPTSTTSIITSLECAVSRQGLKASLRCLMCRVYASDALQILSGKISGLPLQSMLSTIIPVYHNTPRLVGHEAR